MAQLYFGKAGKMAEDKTETKISFIDACLEVWTEPRETVREIIDHKPGYGIWVFILLGGLLETLKPTYTYGFLKWMPLSLAFGAALFFIEMDNIISFWVGSTIAYGLGKILGGKGTFWGVATANAWASPPILVATFYFAYMKLPLWLKILKGANPLPEGPMIWWQVLLGVVACVFA